MNGLFRHGVKLAAICRSLWSKRAARGIFFLTYHKVDDRFRLELDLPCPTFLRQLKHLAQTGRVVTYQKALQSLQQQQVLQDDLYVLTFDDGFRDFYTHAFPLLQELNLPAILFVTTGFIETGITYPLATLRLDSPPLSWDMLGEMAATGLITLAAHTHTHPLLPGEAEGRVVEELVVPKEMFRHRLGMNVQHFAYPEAVWDERVEGLVKQHYISAVIGTGKIAIGERFNPYRIPRVAIRRSDCWLFFQAKTRGWLEQEEGMYQAMRLPWLYKYYLKSISAEGH